MVQSKTPNNIRSFIREGKIDFEQEEEEEEELERAYSDEETK